MSALAFAEALGDSSKDALSFTKWRGNAFCHDIDASPGLLRVYMHAHGLGRIS